MSKHYLFGLHAVESALQNHPERISRVLVQQNRRDQKIDHLIQLAKQLQIPMQSLSRQELDKLTRSEQHQGIAACCSQTRTYTEHDLEQLLDSAATTPLFLILDGVQDPHNLGACFRSADAAGATAIIAPKDNAVGVTPIVSKVACGAAETVPFIQVTNLARAMEKLKSLGVWLYGAAAEAQQTVYETHFSGPTALVLGAEGSGLRRLTRDKCDQLIKIPMRGTVSSLNVSVATGILLFEIIRQQNPISCL